MNPRYEQLRTRRDARKKTASLKYDANNSEGTDKIQKSGSELEGDGSF